MAKKDFKQRLKTSQTDRLKLELCLFPDAFEIDLIPEHVPWNWLLEPLSLRSSPLVLIESRIASKHLRLDNGRWTKLLQICFPWKIPFVGRTLLVVYVGEGLRGIEHVDMGMETKSVLLQFETHQAEVCHMTYPTSFPSSCTSHQLSRPIFTALSTISGARRHSAGDSTNQLCHPTESREYHQ